MTNDRRMTTDRFFGGVDGRLDNLQTMLAYVLEEEPSQAGLWTWLKMNTSAGSDSTIETYLQFIRSISLLERRDDRYVTTDQGEAYAESGDPELIFQTLTEYVKGFETILQAIEKGYRSPEDIQDQLREQYPDYSLPLSIVGRHLEWLEAVGAIEEYDEQYVLTEFGRAKVNEFDSRHWLPSPTSSKWSGNSNTPQESVSDSTNLDTLRQRAEHDATDSVSRTTHEREVVEYERSTEIRQYVLRRATGVCEGCEEPAPFISRSGKPYLQAHHIHELSDGGPDTPDTVIALCPNCHYRVHHGQDGAAYNRELAHTLAVIEDIPVDEILKND